MLTTELWVHRQVDTMLTYADDYSFNVFGFDHMGRADCIMRTANFAAALQDWDLLLNCMMLLKEYKRWPDWLELDRKQKKILKEKGYKKFRSQRSMTRDPYKYTLTSICLMEGLNEDQRKEWIRQVRIPFWMNRSGLWLWKRALLNKKYQRAFEWVLMREMDWRLWTEKYRDGWKEKEKTEKGLRRYFYDRLVNNLGYPGYVKHLHGCMIYVTGSERLGDRLLKYTPQWNHVLKILCGSKLVHLEIDFIENYRNKKGFQWNGEAWRSEEWRKLPETEKYKWDKDWLDMLYNRWKKQRNG